VTDERNTVGVDFGTLSGRALVAAYDRLYREYVELYDWFGRGNKSTRPSSRRP